MTRPVVIVGGADHGAVANLADGVNRWTTMDGYAGSGDITHHTVRKAWYVFPGRTGVQVFEVVGGTGGIGCRGGARATIVADAATVAWSNGFAAADAPDVLSTVFLHGSAWIDGAL